MLTREDAEALAATVPAVPYVAGSWHSGRGLHTFDLTDPVTERPVATVAEAGADTVDAAVRAGRDALAAGDWGRLDGAARGMLLSRLADLLDARREEFAALESLEVGKPGFEPRVIDLPQAVRTCSPTRPAR
jgi:acyl-CoA reductase-like NAD-dependent aldehyde dehydrogenase